MKRNRTCNSGNVEAIDKSQNQRQAHRGSAIFPNRHKRVRPSYKLVLHGGILHILPIFAVRQNILSRQRRVRSNDGSHIVFIHHFLVTTVVPFENHVNKVAGDKYQHCNRQYRQLKLKNSIHFFTPNVVVNTQVPPQNATLCTPIRFRKNKLHRSRLNDFRDVYISIRRGLMRPRSQSDFKNRLQNGQGQSPMRWKFIALKSKSDSASGVKVKPCTRALPIPATLITASELMA